MKNVIEHLSELRKRLLGIFAFFFLFFIVGTAFSSRIIDLIIKDITPADVTLAALSPLEYIYTQIQVGFYAGLIFTLPLIFYHIIMFFIPAMKKKESKGLFFILPSFIILFMIGCVFSYFIFIKIALLFLAKVSSIENIWSISKLISFVIGLCVMIGVIFELPLVLLIMKKLNIITKKNLTKYRPHIYVMAFVLSALFTPPDVITQIIIGIPIVVLFEISLLLMRL